MQTKFDIGQTVWLFDSDQEDYPVYCGAVVTIEIDEDSIIYRINNDMIDGYFTVDESLVFSTEAEAEEASMKLLKESIAGVEKAIENKKARLKELKGSSDAN